MANQTNSQDAVVLAWIARMGPPMLSEMALDRLATKSGLRNFHDKIAGILRARPAEPKEGNFLKRMMRPGKP